MDNCFSGPDPAEAGHDTRILSSSEPCGLCVLLRLGRVSPPGHTPGAAWTAARDTGEQQRNQTQDADRSCHAWRLQLLKRPCTCTAWHHATSVGVRLWACIQSVAAHACRLRLLLLGAGHQGCSPFVSNLAMLTVYLFIACRRLPGTLQAQSQQLVLQRLQQGGSPKQQQGRAVLAAETLQLLVGWSCTRSGAGPVQ